MSLDRAKVAFFDFAGCEGCQLTVLDALQTHPELLDVIEIVQFREAMSECTGNYDIAFVEGSCVWPSDEDRLMEIREHAQIVVALGACAHMGGVNAIRNTVPPEELAQIVYLEMALNYQTDSARPIDRVIPVDAYLPGCPIDRTEFIQAVTTLLEGTFPSLPSDPVCVECKLRENQCLLLRGEICLGPITRAGCGAICPTFNVGCEGCRGMVPDANIDSLRQQMLEGGQRSEAFQSKLALFSSPMSPSSSTAASKRDV
jgi:sulfhydrogenase subunit delta